MTCHSGGEADVPVHASACLALRLLAWIWSTIVMAVASACFGALAFPDMLAASALLALVCATPFQRDATMELALSQLSRHQALERSSKQQW